MPVPQRDLELTRKQLLEWFATKLPDAKEIRIPEFIGSDATGFSNDTLMFDLLWKEHGEERKEDLVVRIRPTGIQIFPHYDLGQQFRVMQILSKTDVPVPRVFWEEEDKSILGEHFYIMGRIEGKIPADNPPYHSDGWMKEIGPEERASIWWSGLEVLARIHKLDWRALGFDFLDEPGKKGTHLERQLEYYEQYLEWAGQGSYPMSEAGHEWLKKNRPEEEEPVGLCWGDSRLGNMIFHENRCVAVLDWEMVTLGNPEQDLAWWLFFDHHHSEGVFIERLPGLPGKEETIARYEELTGSKVKNLKYYEVFAAFRFSVIMIRVAEQLFAQDIMPRDSGFDSNNICTRLLGEMLGLPS